MAFDSSRPPNSRRPPSSRPRGRRLLLGAIVVAACLGLTAYLLATRSGGGSSTPPVDRQARPRAAFHRQDPQPVKATELRPVASAALPAALQDTAGAPSGDGRVALLGGLTAGDASTDSVLVVDRRGGRRRGVLPAAVHDAAAARIGGHVYLFGGGDGVRQHVEIVSVDPRTGSAKIVGRLPAPSSDQAGAVIGRTAYIVGGFTGTRWLNTIVAWQPGGVAHVVAHLPTPVRYAAVAAADGRLVVAGGSLPNGTATRSVLTYQPGSDRVRRVGRLPVPTTHAAAAALGSTVYVLGG